MRIALVEPSRTIGRIVTAMVDQWNHEISWFSDADAALSCLATDRSIRALITTAELPSMSGAQLCEKARLMSGSSRPLYIIMMSCSDERGKLVEALENGADDFISKPPAPEELRARLRAAERLTTMQDELIQLATTDSLTGLLTRRAFFDRSKQVFERAANQSSISMLVCDLDHFKLVNDRYGHDAGDLVLRKVAEEAQQLGVPVARLGGEEFAFLLEMSLDDAVEAAERFRHGVMELAVRSGNDVIPVTCSIGAAEWEPGDTIDRLLRRADMSLYEAKHAGRNRVIAADSFPISKEHEQWGGVARALKR